MIVYQLSVVLGNLTSSQGLRGSEVVCVKGAECRKLQEEKNISVRCKQSTCYFIQCEIWTYMNVSTHFLGFMTNIPNGK